MLDTVSPTARARAVLARAAAELDAEIRAYPTPVSGCDAQFNHLLAERHRLRRALAALDAPVHIATPRAPDAPPQTSRAAPSRA